MRYWRVDTTFGAQTDVKILEHALRASGFYVRRDVGGVAFYEGPKQTEGAFANGTLDTAGYDLDEARGKYAHTLVDRLMTDHGVEYEQGVAQWPLLMDLDCYRRPDRFRLTVNARGRVSVESADEFNEATRAFLAAIATKLGGEPIEEGGD
jgi:hypothetical protein